MKRPCIVCRAVGLAATLLAATARAEPAALEAFFEKHCYNCHSGAKPEAGLDLATLPRDLSDPVTLARFVRIHDRIARGEMPPADAERPASEELAAVTHDLDEAIALTDRLILLSGQPARVAANIAIPQPRGERSPAVIADIRARALARLGD